MRQITFFNQDRLEAAHRQITSDAGSRGASAYYQNIGLNSFHPSYSTQLKVLLTAFSHPWYKISRLFSSIAGRQVLSTCQFMRKSSLLSQNPTAKPAA